MAWIMKIKQALRDQKGAVVVITAICLVVMVAMVGLAVDVGNLYVVKSELQRAADAGALAGARAIFIPTNAAPPQCAAAGTTATQIAQQNSAYGGTPNVTYVGTGKWDWSANKFTEGCSSNPTDFTNAVRVTAQVSNVAVSLIGLLGSEPVTLSATAIAAMDFVGQLPAGYSYGFPWAISKTCYNYNKNNTDLSHKFKLGSDYHYNGNDSGQWTSFKTDNNSTSYTKGLITNGCPAPGLSIGDSIWIQPGTKATLFGSKNAGTKINQTVIFPVVDTADLSVKNSYPIIGFVSFYITDTNQGSKYFEGYILAYSTLPNASPGGPPFNTHTTDHPLRLVK
jgi:Flp pilus assembly protein TadG